MKVRLQIQGELGSAATSAAEASAKPKIGELWGWIRCPAWAFVLCLLASPPSVGTGVEGDGDLFYP